MSRIRSKDTMLEKRLEDILKNIAQEYVKHPALFGKPDFLLPKLKIAIFADSDFWHGYNWAAKKDEIKTNKDFWIKKIERNIERDNEVSTELRKENFAVIRFWGHDILKNSDNCRQVLTEIIDRQVARIKLEEENPE